VGLLDEIISNQFAKIKYYFSFLKNISKKTFKAFYNRCLAPFGTARQRVLKKFIRVQELFHLISIFKTYKTNFKTSI